MPRGVGCRVTDTGALCTVAVCVSLVHAAAPLLHCHGALASNGSASIWRSYTCAGVGAGLVSTVAGYIRCAFTPSFNWTTLGGLRANPVCPPHSKPPLHIALSCSAAALLCLLLSLALPRPPKSRPGLLSP